MQAVSKKVANAIFAFFVTEYEYKQCIVCGQNHHVLTMRNIGDEWICNECNQCSKMVSKYEQAAQLFAQVRM